MCGAGHESVSGPAGCAEGAWGKRGPVDGAQEERWTQGGERGESRAQPARSLREGLPRVGGVERQGPRLSGRPAPSF